MDSATDRFWTLLEPEHPKAEAFCRKLCGGKDEGDDLYQDSLLVALRGFGNLRDTAALRPWLYRLVVNGYRNRCRTPWVRRRVRLEKATGAGARCQDPSGRYGARRCLQRAMAAL